MFSNIVINILFLFLLYLSILFGLFGSNSVMIYFVGGFRFFFDQ